MPPRLYPLERYLVVRAKQGWSVNLGADVIQVYATRDQARRAAAAHVERAIASGRRADWIDVGEDQPGGIA